MWRKIGKSIAAGLIFLAASASGFAAQPEVSMSIDKQSVLLGDSAVLTITVHNVNQPETPEIPSIPNFDITYRGVRQESFSSFTMIVQGQQVQQHQTGGGFHFDYELVPKRAGVFTIPSFAIAVAGQTFRTNSFQIEVFDRAEQSEDIFLDVKADKSEAYLGEKILVTFSWYFNKDINQYALRIPWLEGLQNFLITDPELDQTRRYQRFMVNGNEQVIAEKTTEFYKGQQYAVIRFQKILTPIATGTFSLEPAFIKCDVVKGYTRQGPRSFFDDFFDSDDFFGFGGFRQAVTEPFSTRSNAIDINVLEIPNVDKPLHYSGAVGKFDFTVSAKPTHLKVGEPITLTMKVTGAGNIEQLELPPLAEPDVFKSYEPESRAHVHEEGGEIVGEKVFEKVLIPRAEGTYEIPPVSFSYFDPLSRAYQTITRGPFQVVVERSLEEKEVQVIALTAEGQTESQKREIQVLKQDIRYIKTSLGEVVAPGHKPHEKPLLWILGFLPSPFILTALFLWQKRRMRFLSDVGYARHKTALENARVHVEQAKKYISASSARPFYDSLGRSLNQYIADKLNQPAAAVTTDFLNEWGRSSLSAETFNTLRKLHEKCELALFSSVETPEGERKKDFEAAKQLLNHFEKVIK